MGSDPCTPSAQQEHYPKAHRGGTHTLDSTSICLGGSALVVHCEYFDYFSSFIKIVEVKFF
jgi:hypothetical protein